MSDPMEYSEVCAARRYVRSRKRKERALWCLAAFAVGFFTQACLVWSIAVFSK